MFPEKHPSRFLSFLLVLGMVLSYVPMPAQAGYTGTPAVQGYTVTFDVIYTCTGNTAYGPSTTAPTNAGTYSVKIAIPEIHETLAGETTLNFTNPKTGNDFRLALWSSLLCGSVLGMAVLLTDNKKRIY